MLPDACFRCGVAVVDTISGSHTNMVYHKYIITADTDLSETHLDLGAGEIVELIPKNDFQCLPMSALDVGWLW
jgi:hypothetical protein